MAASALPVINVDPQAAEEEGEYDDRSAQHVFDNAARAIQIADSISGVKDVQIDLTVY